MGAVPSAGAIAKLAWPPGAFFCFFPGFPTKIVVFSYDAGIITPLFIWYNEYRCPGWDAPDADQ
jgi:hypothetical protein